MYDSNFLKHSQISSKLKGNILNYSNDNEDQHYFYYFPNLLYAKKN